MSGKTNGVVFRAAGGARAYCGLCGWGRGAGLFASRVIAREALDAHIAAKHPTPLPPEGEPFTPNTEQVRDAYAPTHLGSWEYRRAEFARWLASVVVAARAEGAAAERDAALPEGAKWFPDEGGIMWQGKVYYPADYVLTRTDIQAIAAAEREACAQVAEQTNEYGVPSGYWIKGVRSAAAIRARSGDGDPLTTHERST